MKRHLLLFVLIFLVFSRGVFAQVSLSGVVTDETGESLVGVTVVVKGTTTGTVTDIDGKYHLSGVPETATLVFSYIGMEAKEIRISPSRCV